MKSYVVKVESNIKSITGEPWEIELGQHTLLVGSNASHKSSVIQSVELALTGAADDVCGRSVVRDAALLLSLAPGDKLETTAVIKDEAAHDEGVDHGSLGEAYFAVEFKDGKHARPTHDAPDVDAELALPLRRVREVLGSGPKVARTEILRWMSGSIEESDVLARIPAVHHKQYKSLAKNMSRGLSPVDTLVAVASYADKRARILAKEVKGAEVIVSQFDADGPMPTDMEIVTAETTYREAQANLEQTLKFEAVATSRNEAQARREELTDQLEKLAIWIVDTQEEIDSLKSQDATVDTFPVLKLSAALDWMVENEQESCPTCSSPVGLAHLKLCAQHYSRLSAASAQAYDAETKLKHAENRLSRHLSDEKAIKALQSSAEAGVQKLANSALGLHGGWHPDEIEACRISVAFTEAARNDLMSRVAGWQKVSEARNVAVAMKTEAQEMKTLRGICTDAVTSLLASVADGFSKWTTQYLPDGWTFKLQLQEGGKDVFRMGLVRGDKLHAALSGAEWAAVTTAMAMTMADRFGVDSVAPSVLIPEDRAWDTVTLGQVMRSFGAFEGQVIMASTVRPKGRAPKGWTIIDMDEWLETQKAGQEFDPDGPTLINRVVSDSSIPLLQGLGYCLETIESMSPEVAAEIIRTGLRSFGQA